MCKKTGYATILGAIFFHFFALSLFHDFTTTANNVSYIDFRSIHGNKNNNTVWELKNWYISAVLVVFNCELLS